jgi:hypothetical protein
VRRSFIYLSETVELLTSNVEDMNYLRLCYLTYKILAAYMKETNVGCAYWEMLKVSIT